MLPWNRGLRALSYWLNQRLIVFSSLTWHNDQIIALTDLGPWLLAPYSCADCLLQVRECTVLPSGSSITSTKQSLLLSGHWVCFSTTWSVETYHSSSMSRLSRPSWLSRTLSAKVSIASATQPEQSMNYGSWGLLLVVTWGRQSMMAANAACKQTYWSIHRLPPSSWVDYHNEMLTVPSFSSRCQVTHLNVSQHARLESPDHRADLPAPVDANQRQVHSLQSRWPVKGCVSQGRDLEQQRQSGVEG